MMHRLSVYVLGLAVLVSGCCGVNRYVEQSKKAEGMSQVRAMARGAVACAEASGGKLPATSAMVPKSLGQISGKKYMSSPADWEDPAFKCMKYSMLDPQYFQYQWVQKSPTSGTARAVADLDSDGSPDNVMEVDVTCTGTTCEAASTVREGK